MRGLKQKTRLAKKIIAIWGSESEHPINPTPIPPAPPAPTGTDYRSLVCKGFRDNYGAREWDSTVGAIQTWYYGSYVHDNWCASSISYFCDQAGCLDRIGGKNDNVYDMMLACQGAAAQGKGVFYTKSQLPATIPAYAICFFLWGNQTVMTSTSNKHVTLSVTDNGDGTVDCIGGNQSNRIRTSTYNKARLYAMYIISGSP